MMNLNRPIRLGTRGSPLALKQTEMVRAALAQAHPQIQTEVVVIKTSGDWAPEQGENPLDRQGGGKALFAKEIEEQLLAGKIDAGVHSMKDMESILPEGLAMPCMLPREDVRDAMILKPGLEQIKKLEDIPEGAVIGTCSLRRQGFLLAARPDLKIECLRGNVGTRLEKLKTGNLAGILLARAGLNRLDMAKNINFMLDVEDMIPAAGQGAIGIEISKENHGHIAIFSQINDNDTLIRVQCERAALAELGGSCHTPVGAHAVIVGDNIWLRTCLVSPDGKEKFEAEGKAPIAMAQEMGREVGGRLRSIAPHELL